MTLRVARAVLTGACAGLLLAVASRAQAVVTCAFVDPGKAVKAAFPDADRYELTLKHLRRHGGKQLRARLEAALGRALDEGTEYDVHYPVYRVIRGGQTAGYLMCSSERGQGRQLQIGVAVTPDGKVARLLFDQLQHPAAEPFRTPEYRRQFEGLSLADFAENGRAKDIQPPAGGAEFDDQAIREGVHKLLMLFEAWLGPQKPIAAP
jgi:hypothetical protein